MGHSSKHKPLVRKAARKSSRKPASKRSHGQSPTRAAPSPPPLMESAETPPAQDSLADGEGDSIVSSDAPHVDERSTALCDSTESSSGSDAGSGNDGKGCKEGTVTGAADEDASMADRSDGDGDSERRGRGRVSAETEDEQRTENARVGDEKDEKDALVEEDTVAESLSDDRAALKRLRINGRTSRAVTAEETTETKKQAALLRQTQTQTLSNGTGANKPRVSRAKQPGIIYISRLPPGMDTTCVRALLSKVGPVHRMWLRPVDVAHSSGSGSNKGDDASVQKKKKQLRRRRAAFADGWVEFRERAHAKRAVALLNGRAIAPRGRWANDLWAMRLLRDFNWDDLTGEVFGAPREHVRRAVAEVADARRERFWVETRTALARRVEKRPERPALRSFKQRRAVRDLPRRSATAAAQGEGLGVARDADEDERRAAVAAARVDEELSSQTAGDAKVDADLVRMLFRR